MQFFIQHDPALVLKQVKCPTLVLVGSKDTQVDAKLNLPPIEAALNAGGNANYEIVELNDLNHLFQTCETGGMSEYNNIEETIATKALDELRTWLLEVTDPR
jgi:uncharacterized protein